MNYSSMVNTHQSWEPINISFNSVRFEERILSNLFEAPFVLDELQYASAESFWQSLRFPEWSEMREKVRKMNGYQAKNSSKKWMQVGEATQYMGKTYIIWSIEHRALMKRALREKFLQNPELLKVLIETWNTDFTHILLKKDWKTPVLDSKTLPGQVFCRFLTELRDELKDAYKPSADSLIEKSILISRSVLNQVNWAKNKAIEILDDSETQRPEDDIQRSSLDRADLSWIFSIREEELKKMLEDRGVNVDTLLWAYGEIILSREDIQSVTDERVLSFLQDAHLNRRWMGKLSSRWKGYYFNFDWMILDTDKNGREAYNMNSEQYFTSLWEYILKIKRALQSFEGKKMSDLWEAERKVFLFILDHYRNVLLFLKSQQLMFNDFESFNRIMSKGPKKPNEWDFEIQLQKTWFFNSPMFPVEMAKQMDDEISQALRMYFDVMLKEDTVDGQDEIRFNFLDEANVVTLMDQKYWKILKKFSASKKYISRFLINTIRVNREADSPLRTAYSGINFMASHLSELQSLDDIQIVWMVYWGIEIPYILKYLFSKSRHTKGKEVYLDFLIPPGYSYRWDIPFNLKKEEIWSKNIILVDDNVCSWTSIVYAKGLLTQVAEKLFCMVVDSSHALNEVSVSVYDTIAGFLPMKPWVKWYWSKLPYYLKKRWIKWRV